MIEHTWLSVLSHGLPSLPTFFTQVLPVAAFVGGVGEGHMCAPSVDKKLTLGIIPQEPPTLALFVFLFLETGSLTVTGVLPIRLG